MGLLTMPSAFWLQCLWIIVSLTLVSLFHKSMGAEHPLWLNGTCINGNALQVQMDKESTTVKYVHSSQTSPSGHLHRQGGPIGMFDCDIYVNGVTGKETIGLMFTWFQLPSANSSCEVSASYVQVVGGYDGRYTKTLLSVCGKRESFCLITSASQIRIEIRGNMGNGFAFGIYSSSQNMLSETQCTQDGDDEGKSTPYAFIGIPIAIGVVFFAYKHSRSRMTRQRAVRQGVAGVPPNQQTTTTVPTTTTTTSARAPPSITDYSNPSPPVNKTQPVTSPTTETSGGAINPQLPLSVRPFVPLQHLPPQHFSTQQPRLLPDMATTPSAPSAGEMYRSSFTYTSEPGMPVVHPVLPPIGLDYNMTENMGPPPSYDDAVNAITQQPTQR